MKRHPQDVKAIFDQSFPVPSQEQTEETCERVLSRLSASANDSFEEDRVVCVSPAPAWWRCVPIRAAAVLVVLGLSSTLVFRVIVAPRNVYAVVETGSVYRLSDGRSQRVNIGDRLETGKVFRTSEDAGAVFALPDGSKIEMQAKSEFSLELASDGVKIRLNDGSVRVTPAKEPAANLYVQNREATVPVTGDLFQTTAPAVQSAPGAAQETFEVVSIRPGAFALGAGIEVNPGRFSAVAATLHSLIAVAYGTRCSSPSVVTGGQDWMKSEQYAIQAIIPAGSPAYTRQELLDCKAPKLQKMLQNLLADRFKLIVRRETKEMPVYNLVVVKQGKLNLSEDQTTPKPGPIPEKAMAVPRVYITGSMPSYAGFLQNLLGRPVIDRTDTKGIYDFLLLFPDVPLAPSGPRGAQGDGRPPNLAGLGSGMSPFVDLIPSALEEQLGLKLESTRAQVEVFVIEHAEKASEN
jgi:uncharacterized protein (TIGR03435 family)